MFFEHELLRNVKCAAAHDGIYYISYPKDILLHNPSYPLYNQLKSGAFMSASKLREFSIDFAATLRIADAYGIIKPKRRI